MYIGYRLISWNSDFSGATNLADLNLKTASFAILAIGVVIALISFLGFFGACCENAFMLNSVSKIFCKYLWKPFLLNVLTKKQPIFLKLINKKFRNRFKRILFTNQVVFLNIKNIKLPLNKRIFEKIQN